MSDKQLMMVAEWEREKEQECARAYQLAQQHADENKKKLNSLEQYRLDYLRQTQNRASSGVGAKSFIQYQSFIGKLDKACEQQSRVHSQSLLVADQRRDQWLKQQQKRKAVEFLIDKKRAEREAAENKREQQISDEMALQRFIRK